MGKWGVGRVGEVDEWVNDIIRYSQLSCVQWVRQMATAALTIPRAKQTYSRTELDLKLSY